MARHEQPEQPTRYFVVDVSALTKGLGNIRKWLETDAADVVLWIPSYTIHELDYLKKGVSMAAVNAREGMRLIEKTLSSDNATVAAKIMIETPAEVGPKWKDCVRYKVRAPKVQDFKPQLAHTAVPLTMTETQAVQLEAEASANGTGDDANERAEMPARYRFLLRPLIQKVHKDPQDWVFITEDSATRIWAESFRIPCINVSEADALVFHADSAITGFTQLSISNDNDDDNGGKAQGKKRRSRSKKSKSPDHTTVPPIPRKGPQEVRIEKFDAMDYAPRGKGSLWVP